MDERERLFAKYPLGCQVYYALAPAIFEITAHLESTWLCSNQPWYGVAAKLVIPSNPDHYEVYSLYTAETWPAKKIVAGQLPDKFTIFCLNGGGHPNLVKPGEMRLVVNYTNLTVIVWHSGWLASICDPGDHSVGIDGGLVVLGAPGCFGIEGNPDFPFVARDENGDPIQGTPWLPQVFWHLWNRIEEGTDDEEV